MLELCQNGKKRELDAIYSRGKEGQAVIYGENVNWGENPNPIKNPLSQYLYLSIFTIVKKNNENYILKDAAGELIKVSYSDASWLYDAQEWLLFNEARKKIRAANSKKKIEQLEDRLDLLKDILIKQGIHIVTEAQAKKLDLG